ncbi:cytochrome c1 [Ralstonia sp. 25C]|uniref:cytochrome c1 n=1 Tax=Ralstonia sp. 25C TaxID=3447363 RepID=UPI003F74B98C
MKKLLAIFALAGLVFAAPISPVMANEGGVPLDPAPNQSSDTSALQRGAKLFVNYCLNCHGASAMRYNRLRDIGLTEDQIKQNLLFTSDKVGDTMHIAMDREDAKKWFGVVPPDLSVIARARGSDWLYTYLRTFYRDDTRPTGWNNLVFDKVGMPHVLWELQGERVLKAEPAAKSEHGEGEHKPVLEQVKPGKLSNVEYDQAVADLVTYLDWMAEPAGNLRKRLGVWVLLFIGVFFVLAWRLNAAYWKDIK